MRGERQSYQDAGQVRAVLHARYQGRAGEWRKLAADDLDLDALALGRNIALECVPCTISGYSYACSDLAILRGSMYNDGKAVRILIIVTIIIDSAPDSQA